MGELHRLFRKDVYTMQMIITSKCERCVHSKIDDSNKAKVTVYCKLKDKVYYWGQCVPCDYIERQNGTKGYV